MGIVILPRVIFWSSSFVAGFATSELSYSSYVVDAGGDDNDDWLRSDCCDWKRPWANICCCVVTILKINVETKANKTIFFVFVVIIML